MAFRIGEHGLGDEYGLGADASYSVFEIADLFGGQIRMLPERRGNRMDAVLDASKATSLGWQAERCIEEYIAHIVKAKVTA